MWNGIFHIIRSIVKWNNRHFQNKSFPSEINFENKYVLFIRTHFPSGNTKMKKVLLFHACKINILATTDIPRTVVINQNEKVGPIASSVHLRSTFPAKMSSYQGIFSAKHIGAPKRQNEPKFNKCILSIWPNIRINCLNPSYTIRHVSDSMGNLPP